MTSPLSPAPVDDRGVVLGHDDATGATQDVKTDLVELQTDLWRDDLAAGQDGDVLEHGLATVTKRRSLDSHRGERAADLVHDQRGQRLAVDVLRYDKQRPEAPMIFSSSGSRSVIEEILPELIKMYGSSRTASIRSGSVTKYGDR